MLPATFICLSGAMGRTNVKKSHTQRLSFDVSESCFISINVTDDRLLSRPQEKWVTGMACLPMKPHEVNVAYLQTVHKIGKRYDTVITLSFPHSRLRRNEAIRNKIRRSSSF